jgi:RNA polymerase sigma factor (sigma-70 family)
VAPKDSNPAHEDVERVYAQYRAELRRLFELRAPLKHRVDDLMQRVFEGLLNYRTLDQVRDLEKFVFKIAWNALRDEIERIQYERRYSASLDAEALNQVLNVTESLWVHDSTAEVDRADLEKVLGELKPEHQRVAKLVFIDGLSYEEACAQTGITIHAVRKYISRVLAHVRKSYDVSAPEQPVKQQQRKAP